MRSAIVCPELEGLYARHRLLGDEEHVLLGVLAARRIDTSELEPQLEALRAAGDHEGAARLYEGRYAPASAAALEAQERIDDLESARVAIRSRLAGACPAAAGAR